MFAGLAIILFVYQKVKAHFEVGTISDLLFCESVSWVIEVYLDRPRYE